MNISHKALIHILGEKDYKKFIRKYDRYYQLDKISGGTMEKPSMVEFIVPIIGASPLVCNRWQPNLKGGYCHG
jgi:hypothetical protein